MAEIDEKAKFSETPPVWFFYIRKCTIASYFRCFYLNCRLLKLAGAKRWLSGRDYGAGYDKAAATYDDQWLCRLRPVTEKLLGSLPPAGEGDILDLGCGTGFSTAYLEAEYPGNPVIGVDISPEMLRVAGAKCSRPELVEADLLEFLSSRADRSAALIFSGWAIGYSNPARVIAEAARVLKPGGSWAFVVNYRDTLAPVFYAFRKCMNKFPGRVKLALKPEFPVASKQLSKLLTANGFTVRMREDGTVPIQPAGGIITLEWLLQTSVLAGFDQVLPLRDDPELAAYFNRALNESGEPLAHHYFMGVFVKNK
ncbi:MAG: methyltransferase domain-containing protein [Victivallaceae bacterium]|nr:methyltransferase domain-containing protein [Victivallaceae bacterium]